MEESRGFCPSATKTPDISSIRGQVALQPGTASLPLSLVEPFCVPHILDRRYLTGFFWQET